MKVYRISRTLYDEDIAGTGARMFGGRWNEKLVPCIYASESRALALLEYTVNISVHNIPRALSIVTFEIDERHVYEIKESQLPGNWKHFPVPKETQSFGTKLLRNPNIFVVKIPSVIMPDEFNFLINPMHYPGKIKIHSTRDFIYDVRIKLV